MESGQTRRTTTSSNDWDPAWSPDGSKIVFTSNRNSNVHNIYVMNADGTGLTRLTTNDYGNDFTPAWSPDGSKIVFTSGRAPNEWYQIYVMNTDGTGITQLTPDTSWNIEPAWSPDGSKIVFCSNRYGGLGSLYVMNADGTGQTQLTYPPPTDRAPAWGLAGRIITLSSISSTGNVGIPYSQTITATGGTAPYSYAVTAGTLPARTDTDW